MNYQIVKIQPSEVHYNRIKFFCQTHSLTLYSYLGDDFSVTKRVLYRNVPDR